MPIPVNPAAGGFQPVIHGPADGDDIDAASVNVPLGELLANQVSRSLLNLGDWTQIPYTNNGGAADALARRVVFGGRSPVESSPQFSHVSWTVIAPDNLFQVYYSYTLSGLPNASGTLTTWTGYTGSTERGYLSTHTGQFSQNVGLFCMDDAAGKSLSTYIPGTPSRSWGAAIAGVYVSSVFRGANGPEVIAIKQDGTVIESADDMTSWNTTAGTSTKNYVGIGRSPTHAATAAGTTVYWATGASALAALPNSIVPTPNSVALRGLVYDRHYQKWIVWSADVTYGGVYTASLPGGTWSQAFGPSVAMFGTDHLGTWIAVSYSTGAAFGRVFASADGGTTWRLIGAFVDEFGGAPGCNEIAHGDGRFAIIGKTNVYFSGRCV